MAKTLREELGLKGENYVPPEVPTVGPTPRAAQQVQAEPVEKKEDLTPALGGLVKKIESLNAEVSTTAQSARLLADPDIRNLLEMKSRGGKGRFMTEEEIQNLVAQRPAPVEKEEPTPDLEAMNNAQLAQWQANQFKKLVESTVDSKVSSAIGQLQKAIEPQLNHLRQSTEARSQRDVQNEVERMKAKYKDFEALTPTIIELNNAAGKDHSLNLEDLYALAKARRGVPAVTQREMESEKPSQAPGQRRATPSATNTLGRNGFDEVLKASRARRLSGLGTNESE